MLANLKHYLFDPFWIIILFKTELNTKVIQESVNKLNIFIMNHRKTALKTGRCARPIVTYLSWDDKFCLKYFHILIDIVFIF